MSLESQESFVMHGHGNAEHEGESGHALERINSLTPYYPYPESKAETAMAEALRPFLQTYFSEIEVYDAMAAFTRNSIKANPFLSIFMPDEAVEAIKIPDGVHLVQQYQKAREVLESYGVRHERRPFGIEKVSIGEKDIEITEEKVFSTAFGTLLHFEKNGEPLPEQPRVLLVAPLSGHFATLLRDTIATMLPDNDVYVTDWHNARDIPAQEGKLGLDEYADSLVSFMEHIGPGGHVVSICQSCPAPLVATATMTAQDDPATPLSLTLMAGPVDTRINPTIVNKLATVHDIDWFAHNLVTDVPKEFPGAGRRVYPGFTQLNAFVTARPEEHKAKIEHLKQLEKDGQGESEEAQKIREFYDEYMTVLDLPGEFYLDTIYRIFQQNALQKGFEYHGKLVDFTVIGAAGKTMVQTIEGEKDDVCGLGQTEAAQDLCAIPHEHRRHYVQEGVGHYGVFSGRRWRNEIYGKVVKNLILEAEGENTPELEYKLAA